MSGDLEMYYGAAAAHALYAMAFPHIRDAGDVALIGPGLVAPLDALEMREILTATGAAAWASYLVNGDSSGLDAREIRLADAWAAREFPGAHIVSCSDEARFTWHYGLHTGDDCAGGDVLEYTALRECEARP